MLARDFHFHFPRLLSAEEVSFTKQRRVIYVASIEGVKKRLSIRIANS